MDDRIVQFIASLRATGVRISVAESADALRAIEQIGIGDKDLFRVALQTAIVKEAKDLPVFQSIFALYFGNEEPPMQPPNSGAMSNQEQQMLDQMLDQMLQQMSSQQLAKLFEAMMSGQQVSQQRMRQMVESLQPSFSRYPSERVRSWIKQNMLRQLRFRELQKALNQLLEQLRDAGMREENLRMLEETAYENMQTLADQVEQQLERQWLEQMVEQQQSAEPNNPDDVMDRPFDELKQQDVEELRQVVQRLATRLRSQVALRLRRSQRGFFDARNTIRSNLRFGGVPMVVQYRHHHLKPRITILCDLSYSMRPVASFTLLLIYALQDQVSRTRSFAFIDDLTDISTYFLDHRPEQAIELVQQHVLPPYSYATDFGTSLSSFMRDFLDCVDHRTTLIVLGDGRNNYREPNVATFEQISQRAHRVIWFNPEHPSMWGQEYPDTLNSDMLDYAPLCDAVHHVSNLRQLIAAVDTLF